jgi:hypothetical protein
MTTETTQQIIREAPEIEAYKLQLLQQAQNLALGQTMQQGLAKPEAAYRVAGFSPAQQAAMDAAAAQGIGYFTPYLTAAGQGLTGAQGITAEAADVLRGADTRNQFQAAQQAMSGAGQAAANVTGGIGQLSSGFDLLGQAGQRALMSDLTTRLEPAYQDVATGINALAAAQTLAGQSAQANLIPATSAITTGIGGLGTAQQLGLQSRFADFAPSQQMLQQAAMGAGTAAMQPGFGQAQRVLGRGIGTLGGVAQQFGPEQTQQFMNPYQQQVIDEAVRQINRQGELAQQNLAAQAVRTGAFGGTREGVQRAELERGLAEQRNAAIVGALQQGYGQAQQTAQQAFEAQQQRQLAQAQAYQSAAGQAGALAAQRAGLGLQGAAQQAAIGSTLGQQAAQQAQLGQSLAQLYGQQAAQQGALGQNLGQLGVQQAQLGQSAAGLYAQAAGQYGQLAGQGASIAAQEAGMQQNIAQLLAQQATARGNLAGQYGNIYAQQAGLMQNLGQGIGGLAGQQFGIGQQMSQGLGALGAQAGQQALQQAALGQTGQAMSQADINFLYNTGQAQQALNQQTLEAQRATTMQQLYAPYQQLGFLSDIYKGAPSTQMATTAASTPTPSPFQQLVGTGLGIAATASGLQKANLL